MTTWFSWEWLRTLAGVALLAVNGCLTGGCKLPGSRLEMALADAADQLGKKVADEGVLEKFLLDADGHVQDPGLESYVQVTMAAGVRAKGINGNIVARASGDSTRLPAGMRETLVKQLDGPLSDEQRAAILQILGWNRTPPGGTPGGP